jgi:hypothetical protein
MECAERFSEPLQTRIMCYNEKIFKITYYIPFFSFV